MEGIGAQLKHSTLATSNSGSGVLAAPYGCHTFCTSIY